MSKIGRNDPCPCGSGKKYKKCHPGDYDPDNLLARAMPTMSLYGCWVADDYDIVGLGPVIVARYHLDSDRLIVASFMCDIFCLGVKDVLFEQHVSLDRLESMLDMQSQDMVEINYDDARELILGAVRYAEGLGFAPHIGYDKAKYTIEHDKPFSYNQQDFGWDGKPFYYTGPAMTITSKYLRRWKNTLAKASSIMR